MRSSRRTGTPGAAERRGGEHHRPLAGIETGWGYGPCGPSELWQMYERNVGRDSPLKIERGLNRLWNPGGLHYAPPID